MKLQLPDGYIRPWDECKFKCVKRSFGGIEIQCSYFSDALSERFGIVNNSLLHAIQKKKKILNVITCSFYEMSFSIDCSNHLPTWLPLAAATALNYSSSATTKSCFLLVSAPKLCSLPQILHPLVCWQFLCVT